MNTTISPLRPTRNDPCYCGSGRKYKLCCLDKDEAEARVAYAKAAAEVPEPAADASASAAPARTTKHQTQQPWKTNTRAGAFQKVRTPRKVGGG